MPAFEHLLRSLRPVLFTGKRCYVVDSFIPIQSHGVRSVLLPGPYKKLRHTDMTSLYGAVTMENREQMKNITRLSESVVRVLGQNPGQFTLQGTNTYIIGSQNPYILIDTAEGLDSYIPILKSALESPSNPDQVDVSDIIISHWHHDHVGGIPSVLKLLKDLWEVRNAGKPYTPPRLHKYPLPDGVNGGHTNSEWNKLPRLAEQLSKATYTPSLTGHIFHDLFDSQVLQDHNGSPVLRVLYTPGHTVDSIALYVYPDSTLYTADTVLGHGTAVFEDLAAYLTSLKRMLQFGTPSASGAEATPELAYTSLYPAHSAVVAKGRELLSTYIEHRLEREAQVIGVLRTPTTANLSENEANSETGFSLWTTWDIVKTLYKGYPESLWLPAARGVALHLKKLESEGFAQHVGGEGKDAKWKLLVSPSATPSL